MIRVFQPIELKEKYSFSLDDKASHHVGNVLRAKVDDPITIFNGKGGEFLGKIANITKKCVVVVIKQYIEIERESCIDIYLAQGISRGDKMDYIIQKAVELGVKKIIPVLTERCTVKLEQNKRQKRMEHWQSIIIHACEQSGRNRLPDLLLPDTLEHHLPAICADWYFVLSPYTNQKLKQWSITIPARILLLIGPEGGLSQQEEKWLKAHYPFMPLNLGPRILRTETASVSAITALQMYCGDMGL